MNEAPSNKSELKTFVRGLTMYDDVADELPSGDLDTLVDIASMRLKNKTGATDLYADDGLAQALTFGTAILAKDAVENYSVKSWSFGDETVSTTANIPPEDSSQLQNWNDGVREGLSASDEYESASFSLTSGFRF